MKIDAHQHFWQFNPVRDAWITEGVLLLGKKGFTYDVLVFPKHLKVVKKFIQQFENQPFVIDHLAKPYIKKGLIKEWAKDIKASAKHENVYCKISGMVTEANWQDWQEADFTPYLDTIFEAFGTDRIMYGSDWPVCLLAATYKKQFSIVENYLSKLSDTEGGKIWGDNAARFYNI